MLSKLLGNTKPASIFVVSAPGGTGKTTLVKKLLQEFESIKRSISYTTRTPRPDEEEGLDYYFISDRQFEEKFQKGDFLEHAKVFDSFYGTDQSQVEKLLNKGAHVILILDTQGATQVKKKLPKTTLIFISPPSLDELKERLKKRKKTTHESIDWKVELARKEMEEIPQYDYLIVNDNLDIAYEKLKAILIANECKM
ncbi:MAG: Guanylate kinase [Chlamydiae bacterium]|nr:Guanylate kinase [Chlamydiota bacterium]